MNIEAQEILNTITKKDVIELTAFDIAFLRARRDYLSEEDREKYESVLSHKAENKAKTEVKVNGELESLQNHAKSIGIRSPHLYKDADKLRAKIAEVEQ